MKETGAGEVTFWSSEMLVTMGATDEEEEATQRKEREGTNNNTPKRHPAITTTSINSFVTSQLHTSYRVHTEKQ